MATEFVNTLKSSLGDYTLMSTWESSTQCVLTAATTKVFSHGGITGSIANNASVTGATSGATGSVVGVTTATQILLDGITGTFASGEAIEVDGSNYVTSSDAGDSPIAVLECYDDWPSGLNNDLTLTGWTTGASNSITIKSATGEGHGGVIGAGFFVAPTGQHERVLEIYQAYVTIQDISIKPNFAGGAGSVRAAIAFNAFSHYVTIERVIVTALAGAAAGKTHGIFVNTGAIEADIRNCLFDFSAITSGPTTGYPSVFYVNRNTFVFQGPARISNNTSIAADSFISTPNGTSGAYANVFKNNICYGLVSLFGDSYVGSVSETYDYNATNLSTVAVGTNWVYNVASTDFVDYAGGDYTPASGGALVDAGADLSGTFTDDITGATRGATFDIGAYKAAAGGGVTHSTLDITLGSYIATGNSVDLSVTRVLDVSLGSYTTTGGSVGLAYSRVLDIAAGSYTTTGNTIGLTASYSLDVAAGSYATTGNTLGLTVGRALDVAIGSYSTTGNSVDLEYAPVVAVTAYDLDITAGSYSTTGNAVDLTVTRVLDIAAGSYAVSGQTVGLSVSRVLDISAGSYAATGNTIGLAASRVLSIDLGTYSTTGNSVTLSYSEGSGDVVMNLKVGGVWGTAVPYINIGGVWTKAVPYTKSGGVWKTGPT